MPIHLQDEADLKNKKSAVKINLTDQMEESKIKSKFKSNVTITNVAARGRALAAITQLI